MDKNRVNPFLMATVFYVIGVGIGQGTTFLSNIVFTRIMSQTDYGLYSNYYSLVSIISGVIGINLFNSLTVGYIDYKERYHEFRSSVLLLATIGGFAFSSVAVFINFLIGSGIGEFYLIFGLLHAFGFFVVNYYVYSLNMENSYKKKTFYLALPNILQFVLPVVMILIINQSGNTYKSRVIGSTVGVGMFAIIAYIAMMKSNRPKVVGEYWKYALRISVPSIVASVASLLMAQSDKIMITSFIGADENAVYSLIFLIGYIILAVTQATGGVWDSWIYRVLDSGENESIKDVQKIYILFISMVATGLFMLAPEIIKIMSPESYWRFEYVTPFVVSSCIMFINTFYVSLGAYHKKNGVISVIVFIAACVNIGLNAVYIPLYGAIVAAYTTMIAQFLMLVLYRSYIGYKRYNVFRDRLIIIFLFMMVVLSVMYLKTVNSFYVRLSMFSCAFIIEFILLIRNWKRKNG